MTAARAATARGRGAARPRRSRQHQQQFPTLLQFPYGRRSTASRSSCARCGTTASSPTSRPDATELPALYELKDGKPALVNFQVQNGTYVVPKVLDRGYLAIGNAKLAFDSRER